MPAEERNVPFEGDPAEYAGSNQANMRAHNERLVLTLIRRHGPTAKADIARATGLSAQTVSVIMRQLERDGLLIKGEPVRGKVGQPSVPMRLAPDGAYFLGLKVGRRSSDLVLTDFLGTVQQRKLATHDYPTPEATLGFAETEISGMLDRLSAKARARVAGIGIAMPFFLWNWAQHLGVPPDRMASWKTTDMRAEIAARFPYPVFLQNDASAACGAELVFGPPDGPRNFLYFYVGYFVGGGVVLDSALYTGAGNAGALGSFPVPTPDGMKQLIDVASLTGLESRLRAVGSDPGVIWEGAEDWHIDAEILTAWIEETAHGLAHAIVASASVIDFEAVLIDGWLPKALCADVVSAVTRKVGGYNLAGLIPPVIRAGTVGPDARTLGAASLPLSERFLVDRRLV